MFVVLSQSFVWLLTVVQFLFDPVLIFAHLIKVYCDHTFNAYTAVIYRTFTTESIAVPHNLRNVTPYIGISQIALCGVCLLTTVQGSWEVT